MSLLSVACGAAEDITLSGELLYIIILNHYPEIVASLSSLTGAISVITVFISRAGGFTPAGKRVKMGRKRWPHPENAGGV